MPVPTPPDDLAHAALFEALLAPERAGEASYYDLALAVRATTWDAAHEAQAVHALGQWLALPYAPSIQEGVVVFVRRARLIGLAHRLLWELAPHERDLRAWLATRSGTRSGLG